MSWRNPEAFLLFIPLLFLLWRSWRARNPALQFSAGKDLQNVSASFKTQLSKLPLLLKFLAMGFFILALARPQTMNTQIKRNVEGIDIVIALDVSDSMLIEDMQPSNRLEAAKETIRKFVEGRASDRIGLVVFAGEAFTLVPPTLDYQLIIQRIGEITNARQARIKDGTALGVALASATSRLKDSNAKSRIVIFMTDGENNSGTIDPETGLEIAKGYGIKIYSIGIGKDGPTRIPVYVQDMFGNKIKTYQPFESSINEELLTRMAADTGGKFFRASKENSLKPVFDEINQLEKTKVDVNKFTQYKEQFESFVLPGLIIYLLSILLNFTFFRRVP